MTSKVLTMLLGGSCSTAWWAFALWGTRTNGLYAPAILLTGGVIILLVIESLETNDK
jgi:hypothetical protein